MIDPKYFYFKDLLKKKLRFNTFSWSSSEKRIPSKDEVDGGSKEPIFRSNSPKKLDQVEMISEDPYDAKKQINETSSPKRKQLDPMTSLKKQPASSRVINQPYLLKMKIKLV